MERKKNNRKLRASETIQLERRENEREKYPYQLLFRELWIILKKVLLQVGSFFLASLYLSTLEMLHVIFIFVNCSNDQVNHIAEI